MYRSLLCLFFVFVCVGAYTVDNETRRAKENLKVKQGKPDCLRTTDGLGCACPVCKEVVQFTRMMIIDHVPTEEQVLDKVCSRVFSEDQRKRDLCDSIVHSELPDMIKYVKNRMDPNKCCAKFC